jgi:hypothetical protein
LIDINPDSSIATGSCHDDTKLRSVQLPFVNSPSPK